MRTGPAERGFTLLETLVALAILGIVMTAVYTVIGSGLRSAHRDEDRLLLGLVAQNLLTRSQLDMDPSKGAITGDIDGGLRWRIESVPYPVPKNLLPEAPPQQERSAFDEARASSSDNARGDEQTGASSFGEESASSFGKESMSAEASPGRSAGENGSRSGAESAGQQTREPLRLRLIRVLVEKGDQQFALSTLAVEPPRRANETR